MINEKHSLAAAAFLITSTLAAPAAAMSPVEQAQAFATCAGRFSAMATRQNAKHDPRFEVSRQIENDFEILLEAALPFAEEAGIDRHTARHWRVAGWKEMAQLMRLQQGHDIDGHADRSARAERDMNRRLTSCRQLILPG